MNLNKNDVLNDVSTKLLNNVNIVDSITPLNFGNLLIDLVNLLEFTDINDKLIIRDDTLLGFNREIIIPEGVEIISDLFYREHYGNFPGRYFNSLTLPTTVTEIGDFAFLGMGLKVITIPDSVTNIGESAFAGNQLTNLTIPDSVTNIGSRAFANNQIINVSIGSGTSYQQDTFDNGVIINVR